MLLNLIRNMSFIKCSQETPIKLFSLQNPYLKIIYRSSWITQLGMVAIILYGKYEDPLKSIDFNELLSNSNSASKSSNMLQRLSKKFNFTGDYDYWTKVDYSLLISALVTLTISYLVSKKLVINLTSSKDGNFLKIERLGLFNNKYKTLPITSISTITPLAPNKAVYIKIKRSPLSLILSKKGAFSNPKTFNYVFGIRYNNV